MFQWRDFINLFLQKTWLPTNMVSKTFLQSTSKYSSTKKMHVYFWPPVIRHTYDFLNYQSCLLFFFSHNESFAKCQLYTRHCVRYQEPVIKKATVTLGKALT